MAEPGQLAETIDKLAKQAGSLQEYQDLCIVLRNLSKNELEDAVSKHNLLDIFGYMDLSDGKFSEAALNIAIVIFSTFRLTEFAHSHKSELLMSIMSKNLPLRDFVISRLSDGVENSPPEDVDIPEEILLEISKIAITEEITTASSARSFLLAFGINHPNGVEILLRSTLIRSFFDSITSDEDVIRLSEIFAYIASKRRETFKEITDHKIFDRLGAVLNKNDPLLQLNVLAVLKLILDCPDGWTFLQSSGAVTHLFFDLQGLRNNPLRDMLLPGYLSFFASLAEEEPINFLGNSDYRQALVGCLAEYLNSPDPTITTSVIEAVAQICRTIDGKKAVADYLKPDGCLSLLFSKAASVMKNAASDYLPRILIALSDMLRLPNTEGSVVDLIPVCEATYEWFQQLSSPDPPIRALARIWDLAKQPFKETRAASLKILRAIASEPWGVSMFGQLPTFMDYLFNPTTEVGTAMDGSSLQPEKFKIVEQCDQTQELWKDVSKVWPLFDNEMAVRVKRCVKDGVWGHRRAEAAVAMENE
ncbi:hypothetical protein Aperf_G00000129394 [Anoplocephala perfoliata]